MRSAKVALARKDASGPEQRAMDPVAVEMQPAPVAGLSTPLRVTSTADACEVEAERGAHDVVAALKRRAGTSAVVARDADPVGQGGGEAPLAVETLVASAGSSGSPLPASLRREYETAMGADLGSVRIHTDPAATAANRSVGAAAFTVGQDIFFRDGLPNVARHEDQLLLAHELIHTTQQTQVLGRLMRSRATADKARAGQRAPGAKRPYIEDKALFNIVRDLYKGTTNPHRVGDGTTADAIRYELANPDAQTHGRSHVQKGEEYLTALYNWSNRKRGQNSSDSDWDFAGELIDDLEDALSGN